MVKRRNLFVSAHNVRPDKVKVIFPAVTSAKAQRLHLLCSLPEAEVFCSACAVPSIIYDAYTAIKIHSKLNRPK